MGHYEPGSFFVEGGINGSISLNNDQYTSFPLYRINVTNLYDAGSYAYDAVNPTWLNGNLTLGFRMSPTLFVTGGIDQTIVGYNAPQFTRFLIGIGYSTEPTRSPSSEYDVDTESEDQPSPAHGKVRAPRKVHEDRIMAPLRNY